MITVNNIQYAIIENTNGNLEEDLLKEKITDYFENYDYIVGDWAYGKLRLKGFNDKTNKNFNSINDSSLIKSYLQQYCAYGCKYFILKRISVD